jgi:hypothetical protein
VIRRILNASILSCVVNAWVACTPGTSGAPEPKVPVGAELVSAASMRADWCAGTDRRVCEDFRDVPVSAIVQFEAELPAILRAKGHPREAQRVGGWNRSYWAALRGGRLFIVGNLVCPEMVSADGLVLLKPICPLISVTFLAGHPETVEVQSY